MNGRLNFPVLVGDIGGTNSRFGLVRDIHSKLEMFEPIKTNDYADLQSAVQGAVYAKTSTIPKRLVLGIAAPIVGDEYKLTNARWAIKPRQVVDDLDLASAEFMNDFPAQALGVLAIERQAMHKIGGGEYQKNGTRVVLGPGTSFGIATIVHAGNGWVIIPGEHACADLGLGSANNRQRELQIQKYLDNTCGRQIVDDMVSGPGLENLYRAIWQADHLTGIRATNGADNRQSATLCCAPKLSAAQICAAGVAGNDEAAIEAIEYFSLLLGRVAGNVALTVAARGGVYVTGGMAHKMLAQIEKSEFRREFERKDPQGKLARSIPTYLVNRELAAVEGLANYVRTPDRFDLTHASAYFDHE